MVVLRGKYLFARVVLLEIDFQLEAEQEFEQEFEVAARLLRQEGNDFGVYVDEEGRLIPFGGARIVGVEDEERYWDVVLEDTREIL